jgi:hypothetical protein
VESSAGAEAEALLAEEKYAPARAGTKDATTMRGGREERAAAPWCTSARAKKKES